MVVSSSQDASARVVAWAGFGVAGLFLVGLFVMPASEFLTPGISAEQLAELYRQYRASVLAGIYLGSLTWGGIFLVFAGALSRALAGLAGGYSLYAWVGLAGAVAESVAILLFCLLSNIAAFVAGVAEPTSVLLLHQGALLANNLSGFPTIVCVGAYTLGALRAGVFPSWLVGLGALCVAVHALSTASLAAEGFASPSGPASIVAPFTMAGWVLGASSVMRRRSRSTA